MFKNSLIPYVGYFVISYIISIILLIFLNRIGLSNFVIIEASIIGASISNYLFYIKNQRAMMFKEQYKVSQLSIVLLILVAMIAFYFSLMPYKKLLLAEHMSSMVIYFGLTVLFSIIFMQTSMFVSARIVHGNLNFPNKIIKKFIIYSLTVFVIDIIVSFLIHFTRH